MILPGFFVEAVNAPGVLRGIGVRINIAEKARDGRCRFEALLIAVVTKRRSPQTTGLECARPGIGVFQMMLVDFSGRPRWSEVYFRQRRPKHSGHGTTANSESGQRSDHSDSTIQRSRSKKGVSLFLHFLQNRLSAGLFERHADDFAAFQIEDKREAVKLSDLESLLVG